LRTDTERYYIESLRRMKAEKKLKIASQLSEVTRRLTRQGIKRRNPQFSPEEIEKELWKIIRHDTG